MALSNWCASTQPTSVGFSAGWRQRSICHADDPWIAEGNDAGERQHGAAAKLCITSSWEQDFMNCAALGWRYHCSSLKICCLKSSGLQHRSLLVFFVVALATALAVSVVLQNAFSDKSLTAKVTWDEASHIPCGLSTLCCSVFLEEMNVKKSDLCLVSLYTSDFSSSLAIETCILISAGRGRP